MEHCTLIVQEETDMPTTPTVSLTRTPAAWMQTMLDTARAHDTAAARDVAVLRASRPELFVAADAEHQRRVRDLGHDVDAVLPAEAVRAYLDKARALVSLTACYTGVDFSASLVHLGPAGTRMRLARWTYDMLVSYLALDGHGQDTQAVASASIIDCLLRCRSRGHQHDAAVFDPHVRHNYNGLCAAALRYAQRQLPDLAWSFDYRSSYRIRPADAAALRAWCAEVLASATVAELEAA